MLLNSKDLVLPGTELGVEEEYIAEEGTYCDEEGKIRASFIGKIKYNVSSRTLSVTPARSSLYPRQGSNVLGIVTNVHKDLVVVEMYAEVRIQPRFSIIGEYKSTFTAGIPLSQVSEDYVKDVYDYFRIGDIIVAKIISRGAPLTLSTRGALYGVLYSQCSLCGHLMIPINQKSVKCVHCSNVEKRKVSALALPKPPTVKLKRLLFKTMS